MRHTASLQVNLDLGADGVWQERWLAANLISPLITASFACSPSATAVCQRARAWQQLDPSRTGYPTLLVGGDGTDPAGEWAQAALAANVMLVRRPDGRSEPCEPGWSFSHWIESGHPDHGWPTAEDLDYHLTTLFFEVRPRGFFELRAGEALSDRWRAAIVVLVSAALYDDRARAKTLAALGDSRGRLPDLWLRAATQGVRDPEIGELADQVWRAALDGARRMPLGFFDDTSLNTTQAFLERFTFERRMPADDLLELQRTDPARALEWATTGGACSAPAHACQ
jgi:glutamate--cysteine ligase